MRKLPRRSHPSHGPSLAGVGFAVLGLAVAGGLGGIYAHRQNQETVRRREIAELEKDIARIRENTDGLRKEIETRTMASTLKLLVRERNLPLIDTPPDRIFRLRPETPAPSTGATAPVASGGNQAARDLAASSPR